jgi:hypothetical protein
MVCCADLENLRLLRPVMVMMAVKFQLWPGASMHAYNNAKLEQVLVSLVTSQEAEGGFLILLYPKNRAEIIAGLGDAGPDLAETLQKLTNEVKDGNGQPLGKHGHTIARS